MEQMSHDEPGGNTKTPGKTHAGNQLYRWSFTLKATIDEPDDPIGITYIIPARDIYDNLRDYCKEFYYQLEEGEDGYLHYQGCFSLINKHRLSECKNILGWNNVHLEPTRNWHALKNYCNKDESRVEGPWSHKSTWLKLITELRPWQQGVVDIIEGPCDNDRVIHWIWEPVGGAGKTQFCKWAYVKLGAVLLESCSKKDIAFALPDNPKIVIFTLARSLEHRVNYGAIEACKDGVIFSSKYESKCKVFNSPHVIVFANFEPEKEEISLDKWDIIKL